MAKADVATAFRCLKIAQEDLRFLGFSWNKLYYFDRMLPMGCSISCNVFETLSCAIQWILQSKLHVKYVTHILDDFMFFGSPDTNDCDVSLQTFFHLSKSIGLPIKHEKTVHPTTNIELHGLWFDSSSMTISVPPDKVSKAITLIQQMLGMTKVSLLMIQSITGLLNFCTKAIPAGRTFLRRLYDLSLGLQFPNHHVKLSDSARLDLKAWLSFLLSFNGTTVIRHIDWSHDFDWRFYSDASGRGYAAVFGHKWVQGTFPDIWLEKCISIKELVPIYLAFQIWATDFKNSKIKFIVDNSGVVSVLQSHSSHDPDIMFMIRHMIVISLHNNIVFSAEHIAGKHNKICDLLSRFQIPKALEMAPWLQPTPHVVPQELMPWQNSLQL